MSSYLQTEESKDGENERNLFDKVLR